MESTVKLRKIYQDGCDRGYIEGSYVKWRGEVVRRINIFYRERRRNYSDDEIVRSIERANWNGPNGYIEGRGRGWMRR